MKTQADIDHAARITLENLTPGGSEFHNDPERCAAYIQRIISDCVEAKKEIVRLRRVNAPAPDLLAAIDELVATISVYNDMWHNDQAEYGDILDSIDNAKAAIAKAKGVQS